MTRNDFEIELLIWAEALAEWRREPTGIQRFEQWQESDRRFMRACEAYAKVVAPKVPWGERLRTAWHALIGG